MGFMSEKDTTENTSLKNGANMDFEPRIYEVGYLLIPTISTEEVPAVYGNLKELVSSLKGEVIADEMPKMIPLAYTMDKVISNVRNKFSNAYFGWVKFAMDPENVAGLKKKLDLDTNFLRFMIIKTVRENTMAGRRFVNKDRIRTKTPKTGGEGEAPAAPINKEEIDKEIDAMVAA